jgi:hypothetical protein
VRSMGSAANTTEESQSDAGQMYVYWAIQILGHLYLYILTDCHRFFIM